MIDCREVAAQNSCKGRAAVYLIYRFSYLVTLTGTFLRVVFQAI